ncbi:Papain inhibitor [Pseudocercospora fuligena]|uniref:Papain inhibitor n=1 Tax=Pseudocercospora fuligena TaxID=685502 RepID=A0A8H6RRZ5_9PEZI|nr:Papain inhibitor [Pseudocercospora fuligena]
MTLEELEKGEKASERGVDNARRDGDQESKRTGNNGSQRIRRVPVPRANAPVPPGPGNPGEREPRPNEGHAYSAGRHQYNHQYGAPALSDASDAVPGHRSEEKKMPIVKEVQVPEWEHVRAMPKRKAVNGLHVKSEGEVVAPHLSAPHSQDTKTAALANIYPHHDNNLTTTKLLDRLFPPHKKYFNTLSRRTFLIILIGIMLSITALVVGLAAGLSASHPTAPPAVGAGATTGWVTYNPYTPGATGACGWDANDSDYVTAIGHAFFDGDANPNLNPTCGRMIRAQYNGQSVDVKVIDSCGACSENDLDMAMGPFQALTGQTTGKISPIEWVFL